MSGRYQESEGCTPCTQSCTRPNHQIPWWAKPNLRNALPLQSKIVVDRDGDVLFGAEIAFRGLYRRMSEEELYLFQVAARLAAELGTGVRRSCGASFEKPTCLADRSTTDQMVQALSDLPICLPPLRIDRSRGPSSIFAADVQALMDCLTQSGIATVRTRLPLPQRSAITQRFFRIWIRSRSSVASSSRRSAQPTSIARMQKSRLPIRDERSGTVSSSFTCSRVSQLPSRFPRCRTFGMSERFAAASAESNPVSPRLRDQLAHRRQPHIDRRGGQPVHRRSPLHQHGSGERPSGGKGKQIVERTCAATLRTRRDHRVEHHLLEFRQAGGDRCWTGSQRNVNQSQAAHFPAPLSSS